MVDESRKQLPWWRPSGSFVWTVLLVVVVVFVNQRIVLDYYVIAPGGARPVDTAINIPSERGFEPSGNMLYTTVSLIRARPFDIVWSQFDPDDKIEKVENVIGDATPQEYLQSNNDAMAASTQIATAVAMRKAGYSVTEDGSGVLVRRVSDNAPATGNLRLGDVVTEVNGREMRVASDLTDAVGELPIGNEVALGVRAADGTTRTVTLKTAEHPEFKGRSYIGITPTTDQPRLVTPFEVELDLGDVGGPSAGLAMTVALLDELTEGELTGGGDIAATGTMSFNGDVGDVGGIKQKVAAVRDGSKAKLFLVPFSEADEARRYAGDGLQVVGVRNLNEAIQAIVAAGGQAPGSQR